MNNPEKTQQNTDTYRLLEELSLPLSTIFLDNFEIVLAMWYVLFFILSFLYCASAKQ
jgi:hypothetical protein